MLKLTKFSLFDSTFKLKLENPEMTLEQWKSHIHNFPCSFKVEKVVKSKQIMGGKKFAYKITTTDPLWNSCRPAVRTINDFHLMQLQLEKRFPNAVVPKFHKRDIDNLNFVELYLKELSLNQFFRMDVAYSDFLNGKQKEYKETKRNDRKHSQGTLRWLQQMTEYRDLEVNEETIISIKKDLNQLRIGINNLITGFASQIKALGELQTSAGEVSGNFGGLLAIEQASETKVHGSASGLPAGKTKANLTKLITLHEGYRIGLTEEYDGSTLEKELIDPLTIIVRQIKGFKRVLDQVGLAKIEFDKAQQKFEFTPNESPNRESMRNTYAQKEIVFFKEKNALMYELERFRTFKTINIEAIYQNLSKFHLGGIERMRTEWSKSGVVLGANDQVTTNTTPNQLSVQVTPPPGMNLQPLTAQNNSTAPLPPAMDNTQVRSSAIPTAVEVKLLKVVQDYTPKDLSSRLLKVSKGELLTGYQLDSGDWEVTNINGQNGIVKASNVNQTNQNNVSRPAQPSLTPRNAETDDDWSTDDDV